MTDASKVGSNERVKTSLSQSMKISFDSHYWHPIWVKFGEVNKSKMIVLSNEDEKVKQEIMKELKRLMDR